jgi:fused signal recognition particle receptor
MNGVDKSFQEKQATSDDISGQREELQQPLEDRQAKATAKPKPEVEKVRRMVEAAMLKADEGKMIKWKAQAEKHAVEEARVSDLKAKAESAECKAQAAEREAEAAKVVILEAATELEKAAASEVRHAASSAAKVAREEAKKARKAATKAANRAAQLWCT